MVSHYLLFVLKEIIINKKRYISYFRIDIKQ